MMRLTTATAAMGLLSATMLFSSSPAADAATACPPMYAHQGQDVGTYSSDSMLRLAAALRHGFQIETDLRPTADKGLVIYHNADLDGTTTDGTGLVNDRRFAYVTSRHYRDGSTIGSWKDLLDLMKAHPGHRAIVEVKPTPVWTSTMLARISNDVAARGLTSAITFDSQVKSYLPKIEKGTRAVETAIKNVHSLTPSDVRVYADSAVADYDAWTATQVAKMHSLGGRVYMSGAGSTAWSAAVRKGADGIVTAKSLELKQWCANR
jgi:glycerophosphoryl diester phosphodiesterase